MIGCGNVAAASVYSLLNGRLDVEVVLFNSFAGKLLADVMTLIDEMPVRSSSTIRLGNASDLADSMVCVLSSGLPPVAGDTLESITQRNLDSVVSDAAFLRAQHFNGVLVVTTNPATAVMAQAASEASGLPVRRVIGLGTNSLVSFADPLPANLPLATWCSATECVPEFMDECHPDCPYFEQTLKRSHIYGTDAARRSPPTMASCVMRICEAVIEDERSVFPVSAYLNGEHGILGTFVNVPCVIGKYGVERVLDLPLTQPQRTDLLDAARHSGRIYHRFVKRPRAMTNAAGA